MIETITDSTDTAALAGERSEVRFGDPSRPSSPRARRRWLRHVVTATLVVTITALAFVAYGLIDNRWYQIVAIEGGSMAPTFEAGDAIVVTPAPQNLEVGMIVVLQVDGDLVTHRVVEVTDGGFRTRGDANEAADDFSEQEVAVVGLYRFRIPGLGRLLGIAAGSGAYVTSGATMEMTATGECPTGCDEVTEDVAQSDHGTGLQPRLHLPTTAEPPPPAAADGGEDVVEQDQPDPTTNDRSLPRGPLPPLTGT